MQYVSSVPVTKIIIWSIVFGLLAAYSWQVLYHFDQSDIAEAHAAQQTEGANQGIMQAIINRLNLRYDDAEERCASLPEDESVSYCARKGIFTRMIIALGGHVS